MAKKEIRKVKITDPEIEDVIKEAINELPEEIKKKLENIMIVIQDSPDAEQRKILRKRGVVLMGLFEGVPYPEKSREVSFTFPAKITIFRGEIEKICHSKEEAIKAIKETLYHEIGHFLGFGESGLRNMGL